MCGLLTGQPREDPTKTIARLTADKNNDGDESFLVEYDRTLFFPLTRWIQMNKGEEITHKKLSEFKELCFYVEKNFNDQQDGEYTRDVLDNIMFPVRWAVTHVWDIRGELRPWLATDICKVLVGTTDPQTLPNCDINALNREQEYRGQNESMNMVLSNISSSIMGGNRQYSSDEIQATRKEEQENGDEPITYDHDLSPYTTP